MGSAPTRSRDPYVREALWRQRDRQQIGSTDKPMSGVRTDALREFLVTLEGRRCVLTNSQTGERKVYGFFATRYVCAGDAASAGSLAIENVIDELSSKKIIANSPSIQPIIEVSEVRSIDALDPEWTVSGFTFYEDQALQ